MGFTDKIRANKRRILRSVRAIATHWATFLGFASLMATLGHLGWALLFLMGSGVSAGVSLWHSQLVKTRVKKQGKKDKLIPNPKKRALCIVVICIGYGIPSFFLGKAVFIKHITYIYFVPTHELIEAQRRAFFMRLSGSDDLHNLKVEVDDGNQVSSYEYGEIDPAGSGRAGFNYPYFWTFPTSPWNEKYTITVSSREVHEVQKISIFNTRHTGLLLSTSIEFNNSDASTGDSQPRLISQCSDPSQSCESLLAAPLDILLPLLGQFRSYQTVDGGMTVNPLVVEENQRQAPIGNPETASDSRNLTEWQQSKLASLLSQFRYRILILCSHGSYTKAYADQFAGVFGRAKWQVDGPQYVDPVNEDIIDVQVTGKDTWDPGKPRDVAAATRDALREAGLKSKNGFSNDPDAPTGTLLLWVGHKSPDGFNPDSCLYAQWKPRPGEPHNCQMRMVTPVPVPLIPP